MELAKGITYSLRSKVYKFDARSAIRELKQKNTPWEKYFRKQKRLAARAGIDIDDLSFLETSK